MIPLHAGAHMPKPSRLRLALDAILGRSTRTQFAASPVNPARHIHFQGASGVNDRNVIQGTDWNALFRDRYHYDRQTLLDEALKAWRLNPLARRIVEIQTQYITDGIEFHCDDPATEQFLRDFWNHPLNKVGEHL